MSYHLSAAKRRSGKRPSFRPKSYGGGLGVTPCSNFRSVAKSSNWGHGQLQEFHNYKRSAEQEPLRIDLHQIRRSIDVLAFNQRLTLTEAMQNPELKISIQILQQAAARLYNTSHYQTTFITYLKTKDVYTLTPGTVGQFLFGNTRPDYGETTPECSPIGIGALPSRDMGKGSPAVCPRQVWYYQNDGYKRLTNHQNKSVQEADIYVPLDFNGLTDDQVSYLVRKQVEHISFYTLVKKKDTDEQIAVRRTSSISLNEAKVGNVNEHFLAEGENQLAPYRLTGNIRVGKSQIQPMVNTDYYTTENPPPLGHHQWTWVVIVLIFIIIIAWIGYSISKQSGVNHLNWNSDSNLGLTAATST